MNNVNFKEWKISGLTDREKQEVLRRARAGAEEKVRVSFWQPFFRWGPAVATCCVLLTLVAGFFTYRAVSFQHNLSVVSRLLEEEVLRHREYVYFAENSYNESIKTEELYEKNYRNSMGR